jgi:hypothetical protein
LGFCEAGQVRGVPSGSYTRSEQNKRYALLAAKALNTWPALAENEHALWRAAMRGAVKTPNNQMEVVVALWRQRLLRT